MGTEQGKGADAGAAVWLPGPPPAAPSRLRIDEFHFSLVWVRTVPEQWRYRPRAEFGFLADEEDYVAAFGTAARGAADGGVPPDLSAPWLPREQFWERYAPVDPSDTAETSGSGLEEERVRARAALAWEYSIPLAVRVGSPVKLGARKQGFSTSWAYLYPHGVALVMRFTDREGGLSLEETASRVRGLRYRRARFHPSSAPVDRIAAETLDRLAERVWGPACRLHGEGAEPFSVLTVVRATGAEWAKPVEQGGELHRFLDRAAGLYDRNRDPGELAAARVSSPRRDGHILYGHDRSRCVWFPEHYGTRDVRFSLSNYHRNLVFCTMQTESLGQYVCRVAEDLDERGYLSVREKEYAPLVARSLERLYRGNPEDTYRSRSPQRQMDDNRVTPSLKRVSGYLGGSAGGPRGAAAAPEAGTPAGPA